MAISPDDVDKPFAARWNALVSALLVEPSIKLVARQACDYGFMDGGDIFPGNERLARQTGLTERTVREAWHFLRAAGMAGRTEHSAWTGARRTADRYELAIPGDWRTFPMLGPHAGKFTCQECGRQFNPSACNTWAMAAKSKVPATDKNGVRTVSWFLWKAAFCPEPRSGNGCFHHWKRANGQWSGDRAWKMYYSARGDDWPTAFPKAALPEMRSGTGSEFRQHPEVSSGTPGNEFRQVPEVTSAQGCIRTSHVKVESQRRRASQATHDRRLREGIDEESQHGRHRGRAQSRRRLDQGHARKLGRSVAPAEGMAAATARGRRSKPQRQACSRPRWQDRARAPGDRRVLASVGRPSRGWLPG